MYIDAPETSATVPDLSSYDRIVVGFSAGKDSVGLVLHLKEQGVDMSKVELHHHDVDGEATSFMDWSVTRAYCDAFAAHMGLPIYYSHKTGGFEREMTRDAAPTAPIRFEVPDGEGGKVWRTAGGKGPDGTRLKFPQVSADLSVRWCSAYLKIDVLAASIRNQERFNGSRTLVVTGERAEESPARAKYLTFENHRTDIRDGSKARYVDHWRPVHGWSETDVWAIIRRHGIVPHVAYQLGWGRLSCLACIFGSPNQWATILHIFRERFEKVEARELEFGVTIRRSETIRQTAAKGTPYQAAIDNPHLVEIAKGAAWTLPIHVQPELWQMPAGAFGENAGPL